MSHSLDTLDVPVTSVGRSLDDTDRQIIGFLQRDARMANAEIARRFRVSIAGKRAGHGIDDPTFLQPDRPMSAIGG